MFLSQALDRIHAFSPEQFNSLAEVLSPELLSECLQKSGLHCAYCGYAKSLALTTDTDTFTIDNTDKVMSRVPVAFQCERSGAMQANHLFAWGNGSTGDRGAMPFSGKLVAASLSVTGSASGETITCQVLKDGVAQGSGYQLSVTGDGGTVSAINEFSTPLTFTAGTTLNFINLNATVTAPTTTTGVLLVVYD